jgi:DNA-binding transcriptional regulator YiaG
MSRKKSKPALFERLKKGLDEALQHAQGEIDLKTTTLSRRESDTLLPQAVAEIRKSAQIEVDEFADALNVSPDTIRRWEKGKQRPRGPAARLLQVYRADPKLAARYAKKGIGKAVSKA